MNADITFHYPPELMNLLIDAVPLLNKGEKDVFLFFRGAGVADDLMTAPHAQWQRNKDSIGKHEIVRQVLNTLNQRGEMCLRERRDVLRRVVEFENFSGCWETDQLKAKGLVAEIRSLVNVKDSFTRMSDEREEERRQHRERKETEAQLVEAHRRTVDAIKGELFALFGMNDPRARGKSLEGVLNHLFVGFGVLVREAFTLVGPSNEGIVEQVDGVIELDNHLYFVEMKWWEKPLGVPEISQHLVRVFTRSEVRAIIISASSYAETAVALCRDALSQKVVTLCTLQEISGLA